MSDLDDRSISTDDFNALLEALEAVNATGERLHAFELLMERLKVEDRIRELHVSALSQAVQAHIDQLTRLREHVEDWRRKLG